MPTLPQSRLSVFLHTPAGYAAISAVLLIPCFWQSRVQAGDLGSHLYNAWLADFIRQGKAVGLFVAHQNTNVLFDWILSALLPLGLQTAQRVPVALAVLSLVWGSLAFIRAASARWTLEALPAIAMLAYGWSFHMGLFNFYISLGLCFWALALAWEWRPPLSWITVALLAVAYVAHGLPVAWATAILAYRHIGLRFPNLRLLRMALIALVALAVLLRFLLPTRWFGDQIQSALAIDQVAVYGSKYWFAGFGLLFYWASISVDRLRREGMSRAVSNTLLQVCLLTAVGIVVIPNWILLPGYNHALVFLAQRMSLALGICLCAWTASTAGSRFSKAILGAAMLLFFGFLYVDESALNGFEDRVEAAVAQLPPWQRVVNGVDIASSRVNAVTHILDRACIGRCYSYGDYEPSSGQFRVRVSGPNPFVVATDADSNNLQNGSYIVKPNDLPLYQVTLDASGDVALRPLSVGERTGISFWTGL